MTTFDNLVDRLEELFSAIETFDEPTRNIVIELLDGVDTLHRMAIERWVEALGPDAVDRTRNAHPSVAWLLEAYGVVPPRPSAVPVTLRRKAGPPV